RGEFLGLAGNLAALARDERAIDRDLNRHFKLERITALRNGHPPDPAISEDQELVEVLEAIEPALGRAHDEAFFIDLHTTSGKSAAFATVGDTLRNREFALRFRSPIILGLEEHIEGTLLEYLNGLGYITMGFEGGRHQDPASVDLLEAGVWVALAAAGVLPTADRLAEVERAQRLLEQNRRGLPRVFEVRYRHPVQPEDRFRMRPGYESFQPLTQGEWVAEDRSGDIHAPAGGRILMPLYQTQGDDGFFVIREFSPFWLTVSRILRHTRADQLLRALPGVRRHPTLEDTLVIDIRVARFVALQIFHLLGYRKQKQVGRVLVMSRRKERRKP
ncbi:MAG TPA: succinylglutamate desuccinylase/aspartoacylase family protein, partial [Gemmatimonadales bacterium]|nr:succinylglutamate desuccinylase/aspartoacylase family protein [Gemmatimonadales bacterium]